MYINYYSPDMSKTGLYNNKTLTTFYGLLKFFKATDGAGGYASQVSFYMLLDIAPPVNGSSNKWQFQ